LVAALVGELATKFTERGIGHSSAQAALTRADAGHVEILDADDPEAPYEFVAHPVELEGSGLGDGAMEPCPPLDKTDPILRAPLTARDGTVEGSKAL
jgi:hypothetical protein